jgi:hypothetical protein
LRALSLLALSCAIALNLSSAQAEPNGNLRGLKKVYMLIENVDEDARHCGLTKEMLRSAAMYPLSSSALQIVSDLSSRVPTYYIQTGTLFESGRCYSTINLLVYSLQREKLDFENIETFLPVAIWKTGWLGFSSINAHEKLVREKIEELTKILITDWNLDNKIQ